MSLAVSAVQFKVHSNCFISASSLPGSAPPGPGTKGAVKPSMLGFGCGVPEYNSTTYIDQFIIHF